MMFMDESKALSPHGLPEAMGLFQSTPCAAGPVVKKPTGEGKWPEMGSLGSMGREWVEAGLAWWDWVALGWIPAVV